jgi:hypothetical protein
MPVGFERGRIWTTLLTTEQLAGYFAQKGWKYRLDRDNNAVRADFDVRGGNVRLSARVNPETETVSFIVQGVGQVTENRKAECLEALMHINYSTVLGKYTRDATDGEITYELAIPINGSAFTYEQFLRCMLVALGTVNRYGYLIPKIVFGRMDPLKAVEDEERETASGQGS